MAKRRYCEMCDTWKPATQKECRECGAPTSKAVDYCEACDREGGDGWRGHDVTGKSRLPTSPRQRSEDAMTCRTCSLTLTNTDRANGCKRCQVCRQKVPGRPQHYATPSRALNPHHLFVKPQKATGTAESWWLDLGHAELNAEAARRFTVSWPHLVLQHRGQFGDGA